MEIVKNVAAIVGCILSIVSQFTLCTKSGRRIIKSQVEKNTQTLQEQNTEQNKKISDLTTKVELMLDKFDGLEEVARQQCRDTIKTIYYKYCNDKKIPLYERKTADYTYKIYTERFHGNSYAALLYSQIVQWEIDTQSYQDLDPTDY